MWDTSEFDPADDWDIFDGREDVRVYLFNVTTQAVGSAQTCSALFREVGIDNIGQVEGETAKTMTIVHLKVTDLSGPPTRGTRITREDNTKYRVESYKLQSFGARYRCVVNKSAG